MIKPFSLDQLNEFASALQLCIQSELKGYTASDTNAITLTFTQTPINDANWETFHRMVQGSWDSKKLSYTIENAQEVLSPTLLNFLFLTRLQKENMQKLAELDSKYLTLTHKILGTSNPSQEIQGHAQAIQLVFKTLEEKKWTLRQLAEKSGLSQVSISNFKAGQDIRLSNFIKIAQALGLKIHLS